MRRILQKSELNTVFLILFSSLVSSVASINQITCGKGPSFLDGPGLANPDQNIPWTAQISIREETTTDTTFPAILLTPSLLLASANYLSGKNTYRFKIFPTSSYFGTVGTQYFGDPAQTGDENAVVIPIRHIQIHPSFSAGDWFRRQNDYALFHLETPVEVNDHVQPICLPDWSNAELTEQLKGTSPEEELVLTGWNRWRNTDSVLRLKTHGREDCLRFWAGDEETRDQPYGNKWCATVGELNNHTICIHRDVGRVQEFNGTWYFRGIVDNFYSTNKSRTCYPGALYYFRDLDQGTLQWIERNIRCGPDNFTCWNGDCIPLPQVCDRIPNCPDKSDEEAQFCRGLNFCNEDQFACGVYGSCIPKGLVKDGVENCEDGEDENGYVKPVPIIEIVAGLCLLFLGVAIIIVYFWRRHVNVLKEEIRNLTQDEMDDFLKGCPNLKASLKRIGTLPRPYVNNTVQAQPWKKEFNIAQDDIQIGEELNRGNFGIVYKAILTKSGNQEVANNGEVPVAVKKNSESMAVHEFKAILCELKILAYVGEHANVLKFYGACTDNIKKREVLLVVEFCPNGSLLDYLLQNGKYFMNRSPLEETRVVDISEYRYDISQYGCIDNQNLLLWSTQTAAGMEYLASQNIVHGDLSARNLLLSKHLDIKISDFGLSHRTGYSGVYIKSADDPVPYKWLAIETLQSNTMSEKSDVWGFGVTMWEIYTLGQTPYGGIGWSNTFLVDLIDGLRLSKPENATDKIYDLMTQCWNQLPADRPTFATLRDDLMAIILHCYGGSPKRNNSGCSEVKEAELEYFRVSKSICGE